MSIRFVLWDNDGVLVDTEEGYFQATRRALANLGVVLDRAEYLRLRAVGETAWTLAERAGIDAQTIAQHRGVRDGYYHRFILSEELEIAGTSGVIGSMAAAYRMAIVTTAKRRDFELIHRERRIVRHMEFVLAGEDYAGHKPAPDGYLAALDRFGAAPDEAVVIEDSKQGLDAARAAGLRCIIVRNRFFGAAHDFSGAARVLDSVAGVPGAIVDLHR